MTLKKTLKNYTPDFISRYTHERAQAKAERAELFIKLLEESRNTADFQEKTYLYQNCQSESSLFTLNRFMDSKKSKANNTPTNSNPGCQF